MRFLRMSLRNWRSFYGDNEVEFSTVPNRPITLILGPNGAGKTALLNAFTWVIYSQFTEGFHRRTDLINHEALEVNPDEIAQVKLVLVDDGHEYVIRRTVTAVQQEAGTNDVFVSVDGKTELEEAIHQLLPPALKDLFFFPAETFGTAKVVRSDDRTSQAPALKIDSAIRTLLAGDVYDNAIKDLRAAIKSKSLRIKKVSNDALNQTQETFDKLEAQLAEQERLRETLPDELAAARIDAERAEKVAAQYDPVKIAQWRTELQAKTDAVSRAKEDVDRANDLYVRLARHAHAHFASKAVGAAISRLDYAEKTGLIPPRIDGEVLRRTLAGNRCLLCGEALTEHGVDRVKDLETHVADSTTALRGLEARTSLKGYLDRSATELAQLRDEISDFAARFENVPSPASDAGLVHLRATVKECIDLADRHHKRAQTALATFNDEEGPTQPSTNVIQTAMAKQRLVRALEERLESIPGVIEGLKTHRATVLSDLTKLSTGSKDAVEKTRAIKLIDEARAFFEAAREGLTDYGRRDFERAINETYSGLVNKPYDLVVHDDFRITIIERGTRTEIAGGQAENVLVLLSFLGAIARLAPQYMKIARAGEALKKVGGVTTSSTDGFPVVIDAPTSALDSEYEEALVETLPNLLPQVVVPVSARSVDLWETITDSVGSVYILELTSKGSTNRTVRWGGKDRAYSRNDDAVMGRTKIVQVR